MKYIITENQCRMLSEIRIQDGTWDIKNSYEDVFSVIKDNISEKKIKQGVQDYIKNEIGYHLTKFKKSDVESFVNAFPDNFLMRYDIPSDLKTIDVLSNLSYFLAKRFFKLKKLAGLECLIENPRWGGRQYFFFDPELEQSIGSILVKEFSDYYGDIKFPKDTWTISTSGVDKETKGTGLGKQMYLGVLEDVNVLLSDNFLYKESLNIWVNVLPNYVYVGAVLDNEKLKRISPKTKILNHEDVRRYFATKRPELIKIKKREEEDY